MRFNNENILFEADMSQAIVVTPEIRMDNYWLCDVQAVFAGSPVGMATIQTCNDPGIVPINWDEWSGSCYSVTAAGSWSWHVRDLASKWIRLYYAKTSGTGQLSVNISQKGYTG